MHLPKSGGSYHARLKKVLDEVGEDKPTLIILGYETMTVFKSEIQEAKKTTSLKRLAGLSDSKSQNLLVGIEAVIACQRPLPPLMWFGSRYQYLSNDEEDIKEWTRGKKKTITGRDLITDPECVAGYEADVVIHLGPDNHTAFMSRCRGQCVHII